MLVRRYVPGMQFAEDYVRNSIAGQAGCTNVEIKSRIDRSELARAVNAIYQQFGASVGGVMRLDMERSSSPARATARRCRATTSPARSS